MKRFLLLITVLLAGVSLQQMHACTTFVLSNEDDLIFGRNLDWVSDHGVIVTNPRGLIKTALVMPPNRPANWTSKYGSITFNQFGKEFPFGGMNETGLVIEIMLSKAEYPKGDSRWAVNELQWIQYALDNCSSIEEVLAIDKRIRIVPVKQQLHYLVCDATGNVAVIEFFGGKMVTYTGDDLPVPVLENEPYEKSLSGKKSDTRFNTAREMLDNQGESTDAVDHAFQILEKVKLAGSWSIVYDIRNMEIHFKNASNSEVRTVSFNSFHYDCDQASFTFPITTSDSGRIDKKFKPFDFFENRNVMRTAMQLNEIIFPQELTEAFEGYARSPHCK